MDRRIPTTITVDRKTGRIIEVERSAVDEENFRRICAALTGMKVVSEEENKEEARRSCEQRRAGVGGP